MALVTDQSCVLESQLSALVSGLLDDLPLVLESVFEFLSHLAHDISAHVDLLVDLLGIDWLQEIAFLGITFLSLPSLVVP